MPQKNGKKVKGFSIALVLIILTIVMIFAMAAASLGTRNLNFTNKDRYNRVAFYAAEAGIARALSEIRKNHEWDGTIEDEQAGSILAFNNKEMPGQEATYTVWVYNNFKGSSTITAIRDVQVPPGTAYIYSVGKFGSSERPKSVRYIGVLVKESSPFKDFGIFSKDKLYFGGSVSITAYDSSTQTNMPGVAHIGTNGNNTGAITGSGSAGYIDGSIYAGPGSILGPDGTIIISGNPEITGEQRVLSHEVPMPKVVLPTDLPEKLMPTFFGPTILEPGNYNGILEVKDNETVTLTGPGSYIFKGIEFSGTGTINVDTMGGPVKIYMDGDIAVAGNVFLGGVAVQNEDRLPRPTDLLIYGTDNCQKIAIGGNAVTYAGVFAPNAEISLFGNGELYGALIGRKVTVPGHPKFVYDVTLGDLEDAKGMVKVLSWHRY